MSQENVQIVRKLFAAWNTDDRAQVLELIDPDIVIDATRRVFNPTTYEGMEGVQRMLSDLDDVWDRFQSDPSMEFIDAGERVVVVGRMRARGKGSGVEVDRSLASIWTVRGGRVVRWELGYDDRRAALEAAGLHE
jgi:ketosteroid isomerase-like protein